MFKDKLGQEINLGDYVAYPQSGYVRIYHGIVTKFGNSNNVKVNDFDWAKVDECIVINKQIIDNDIAQTNILKYKDKITEARPSGVNKVKYCVAYSKALQKVFVISLHDEQEFRDKIAALRQLYDMSRGIDFNYLVRHTGSLSANVRFTFMGYQAFTRRCLSRKSISLLGLEEYIDNDEGIAYDDTVFDHHGSYKIE